MISGLNTASIQIGTKTRHDGPRVKMAKILITVWLVRALQENKLAARRKGWTKGLRFKEPRDQQLKEQEGL